MKNLTKMTVTLKVDRNGTTSFIKKASQFGVGTLMTTFIAKLESGDTLRVYMSNPAWALEDSENTSLDINRITTKLL